jgi:hypothetical protein
VGVGGKEQHCGGNAQQEAAAPGEHGDAMGKGIEIKHNG